MKEEKEKEFTDLNENFTLDMKSAENVEEYQFRTSVAASIINYRDFHGLTQSQLAEKLEISQVMVSKLESGKANITLGTLAKLCRRLDSKEYNFGKDVLKGLSKVQDLWYELENYPDEFYEKRMKEHEKRMKEK